MTEHEREVPHYEGRIEDLARVVGRLTYDQTAKFLSALRDDLSEQSEADDQRGRVLLAWELEKASDCLDATIRYVDEAWRICEPFMTPEERGEL